MRKVKWSKNNTMDNLQNYLPLIIGVGIPTVTIIGKGIIKVLEHFRAIKQLENESSKIRLDDEKFDIEKIASDASVANNIADVLKKVIDPLAARISVLEKEASERQAQVNYLNDNVLELKKIINSKDIELDKLRHDYDNQVAITVSQEKKINEQSIKIEQQDIRIVELETKIKHMNEEGKSNGREC